MISFPFLAAHPRLTTIIALFGMVLLLVCMYLPAIHGPFVLDDLHNVPQTNKPLNTIADLKEVALSNTSGPLGRPVPVVSFALNYHFFGLGTTSFKVVNLVIHATTAIIVFLFTRYLLIIANINGLTTPVFSPTRFALSTSLLWAIHPLQVSTVMYVVQRMTLLMALFTITSMLLYLIARSRYLKKQSGAGIALICASVSAALAWLQQGKRCFNTSVFVTA